ncbi:hypothetical protein [Bizionia arctica]|uniref:TNF family profile domain-containing protein n=1 Tax=Bizionia arctica TaxID=1495645 RepID=A0A917GG77_9FLAO|nr:hypothetical protein [Bizionia arctica]GGG44575.1 hypothetical protein GCM10010976_15210 [Bizionia arctica]
MGSKKNIILLSLFCFFFLEVSAQVGIGTTSPSASSALDIESDDSGVLIPRVVLTDTSLFAPISSAPEESLLVYNTNTINDVSPGYYYWKNSSWNRINDNSDKVYGEIYNDEIPSLLYYPDMQDMDVTEPIRFGNTGAVKGVTPIPHSPSSFEGFEIVRSGVYRVSYSISVIMYKQLIVVPPEDPPSAVRVGFYLTTGDVVISGDNSDLLNNRIPGSFSRGRITYLGHTSYSMSKIVHLDEGDNIRLFNTQTLAIIYVIPDTGTMNVELIQAD